MRSILKFKELLDKNDKLSKKSISKIEEGVKEVERDFGNDIYNYKLEYNNRDSKFYVVIDYYTNDTEWYAGCKYVKVKLNK